MVERVARGRLIMPAAAALGLIATGMARPEQASAAGRETTLQIRVQVVESCQIQVSNVGRFAQSCGGGGVGNALLPPPIGEVLDALRERAAALESLEQRAVWSGGGVTSLITLDRAERIASANQRAGQIAERIAQRVRYITVVY